MRRRDPLLALGLAPWVLTARAGILDGFTGASVGQTLPTFDAEYIGDAPSEDRKMLLVDFWATWCAPCREEFPHLNALSANYRARGLEVLGLTQESKATALAFLPKVDIKYKLGAGGSRPLQKSLGIRALPYAILVDRRSTIVWRGQASELLPSNLDRLLNSAA